MKFLLTGYEPLFGDVINPSIEAVKAVAEQGIPGVEFAVQEIPLDFKRIGPLVINAINTYQPDVIICTGIASKRPAISLERVAVNIVSGTDHNDLSLIEQKIANDGPPAYLCELPLLSIRNAILKAGIPTHISDSAGTHGCNYIFYTVSHYIASNKLPMKVAFVHVPRLPEQVARMPHPEQFASMPLSLQVEALQILVREIAVSGGKNNI